MDQRHQDQYLLVPPDFPKFVKEVLRGFTNFGKGALADHSAPAAMALSRHLHKVNACMPELPEVETVRRGLQPAMEGAKIAKAQARRNYLRVPFQTDFVLRL